MPLNYGIYPRGFVRQVAARGRARRSRMFNSRWLARAWRKLVQGVTPDHRKWAPPGQRNKLRRIDEAKQARRFRSRVY